MKREVAHDPRSGDAGAIEERPEATNVPVITKQRITPTRAMFDLAWPIAAGMLGETAIGLVDTKLVGGLGPGALGGVGMATTLMFLGYSMVFGTMRGVKVCTAHAIGEGRTLDGFVYTRIGVVMSALFGVAMMLACRDVSPVLRLLGVDPAIVPFARDFLAAVTLGAPQTCALAAFIQHRQAISDSRTPMVVGFVGNAVNMVFGWSLIYGHFGLPALGVRGGGMATASAETLEVLTMALLFLRLEKRKRAEAGATARARTLSFPKAAREVLGIGLPTGLQYGAEMLAFTAFTAVLGGLGGSEIAAHQIAMNVIRVSFLPGVAVSEAASVMVGTALGRRSLTDADASVKAALGMAVSFMAACGLVFALVGGAIAAFFSEDVGVVTVARRLLLCAAVFQVLDAVSIVLRGALRGAKDVRMVMLIGIAVIWCCVPTAAWFLGREAGFGALGGWLGFVGETTIGGVLFWRRWHHGAWRKRYA